MEKPHSVAGRSPERQRQIGKKSVVDKLVRTVLLLGGRPCSEIERDGPERAAAPLKHPPALSFYPLAWLLTRQELPRSGHRLLQMWEKNMTEDHGSCFSCIVVKCR